ncbi:MAG: histidinol-phosphatase [Clostridia bacterium]|nr:histidinol-phosphatase [Clostridia bacterium]
MLANYHTHTPLCHHAVGEEREYVEHAIRGGIKILGFADHSPQFYKDDFVSGIRMTPAEAEGYLSRVRRLAEEYKDDITIYAGFEAEYFPDIFPRLQAFCRDYGVDYLIMGQHLLDKERDGQFMSAPFAEKEPLTHFVDLLLEGLGTGSFTYLAHPDMVHFIGDEEHHVKELTRLCRGVKALGLPVEVNMLGYVDKRHYPTERFFRIAAEVGNDVIVGCDAHCPAFLSDIEGQNGTRAFAEHLGCRIIETVPFRKI